MSQNKRIDALIQTFKEIFLSNELGLIIFPTEDCNFRCVYCYETFRKIFIKPYVIEGIKNLVRKFSPSSIKLSFFGGEPLLGFRYIQKIIEEIKNLDCKITGSITTNGFLLSENYFSYLINNNIISFQITLDGTKEFHNNQRNLSTKKIDTFSRIFNNILNTKKFNQNFEIIIRVNVTKENFESVFQLIDQLSIHFSKDIRYKLLLYQVKDWGGYGSENIKQGKINLINKKQIFDIYNYAIKKGLSIYDMSGKLGTVCYAGKPNHFVIRANGKIQKCTIILEDDELNTVGYINQNGEIFIDQNKHKIWYERNAMNESKCQSCSFLENCFGLSCPLQTIKDKYIPCCDYKIFHKEYSQLIKT